jgi:hypothetical protein
MLFFANATILNKYAVSYFRCDFCGFIQTEEPYWLEEAYSSVITASDVGLVRRNLHLSFRTRAVIATWFDASNCFLDYAGGYGLFVRLMRDAGYNFLWHDRYCDNLFAKQFDADLSKDTSFEVVTAFEVLEHIIDPVAEIRSISDYSRNMILSTELIPAHVPRPGSWWYYSLHHGQHISFYSYKTLEVIAQKLSLNLYSDGISFHLLTEREISPALFKIISNMKTAVVMSCLSRRKSLLNNDAKKLGCEL